jgi:hypothetical protein
MPLRNFIDRVKERLERELGLSTLTAKPPAGDDDVLARCRMACIQNPPKLIHALYKAEDADVPSWRHLAPYSKRDRGEGTLVFCACEKEGWKIEAFIPENFLEFRITNKPWPPGAYHKYRIEFRDG